MHGTYDSRADQARRLAEAAPRFPLPACDIETGHSNHATARIACEAIETPIGLIDGVVVVTGWPGDWWVEGVYLPTSREAWFDLFERQVWQSSRWTSIGADSLDWLERTIAQALDASITDDRAVEALLKTMG